MSIKFVCSCGKHLRAREKMAGRRSVCPQCGMPVGIPFLNPSQPGAALGHMTPAERLRHSSQKRRVGEPLREDTPLSSASAASAQPPAAAAARSGTSLSEELFPRPLDPALVRLVGGPKQRGWQLEARWHHCLLYPLRAWWLIAPAALLLTLVLAGAMFAAPELLKSRVNPLGALVLVLPGLLAAAVVFGYAASLPEGALISGLAGEFRHIHWPGRSVMMALRSCVVWLACFLAGPVFLLAASVVYWIYCGDPGLLDLFILVEMNLAAVCYGYLALLSFCRREQFRDLNPWQVLLLVHRLEFRVLGVICLTAITTLVAGILSLIAMSRLQSTTGTGWSLLGGALLGGLFLTTFLLRLAGVWCYRARL